MTFLALIAIIFFGFAVYNLTCAFVDIFSTIWTTLSSALRDFTNAIPFASS